SVHFVPSHVHVSFATWLASISPPKRTMTLPSAAIEEKARPLGPVVDTFVQLVPSNCQVSDSAPTPPKRNTLSPSAAIACPMQWGPAVSAAAACAHAEPSHVQVSQPPAPPPEPPKRTILPPAVAMR